MPSAALRELESSTICLLALLLFWNRAGVYSQRLSGGFSGTREFNTPLSPSHTSSSTHLHRYVRYGPLLPSSHPSNKAQQETYISRYACAGRHNSLLGTGTDVLVEVRDGGQTLGGNSRAPRHFALGNTRGEGIQPHPSMPTEVVIGRVQ
jgi:hypothetical protein